MDKSRIIYMIVGVIKYCMMRFHFERDYEMSFENRLQQRLDELGMSQAEFGRLIKATSQSVSGWCNGHALPRKNKLDQFPTILGRPLYWFFMDDSEHESSNQELQILDGRQEKLLSLFSQLTNEEQDHVISFTEQRIAILDKLVAQYLARKKER